MLLVTENTNGRQKSDKPNKTRRKKRRGATALEYLFMASLIIVVCIVAIQNLGFATKDYFDKSVHEITKSDAVSQLDSTRHWRLTPGPHLQDELFRT